MATPIMKLMEALQVEIDRVATDQALAEEEKEGLTEVLSSSIKKTLREIKFGADSEEFHDHTIVNFIIEADGRGYPTSLIREFVHYLKNSDEERAGV